MKRIILYIKQILSDRTGAPSAKRHACAVFGMTAVILAFANYSVEMVSAFLAAALGANIATIFEKGGKNGR